MRNRILYTMGACIAGLLLASPARAGVSCTLPFQLQNNQLADATQVMANYNAIITCLGNAASAGANGDITSLNGITTPIPATAGGSQAYVGTAPSAGTNTITLAATIPSNYGLVTVNKVIFLAGATNTGPVTLQVGSTTVLPVVKRTVTGAQPLVGNEIISGTVTEVVYDGTQYQLMSNILPFPTGTVMMTVGAAADPGFILLAGGCISQTTFAQLYARMGSPGTGGCAAGQFAVPNLTSKFPLGGPGSLLTTGGSFIINRTDLPNFGVGITNVSSATVNSSVTGGGLTGANNTTFASSVGNNFESTASSNQGTLHNLTTVACSDPGASCGFTASVNGNVTQTNHVQPYLVLNFQVKY